VCYILDSEQSTVRNNMEADSDKSLQEELHRFTTGQNGLSESDAGPTHKVCSMFFKLFIRSDQFMLCTWDCNHYTWITEVVNFWGVTMFSLIDGNKLLAERSCSLFRFEDLTMRRRTGADVEKVCDSEPTHSNWHHFGRAGAKATLQCR
jgi:hypothetical protein